MKETTEEYLSLLEDIAFDTPYEGAFLINNLTKLVERLGDVSSATEAVIEEELEKLQKLKKDMTVDMS